MARKRSPLPVQVLLFLLVTLLGVATGNLNSSTGALPWGSELLRRQSLPLAGITVLLIIGVLVWQHRADELRTANGRPNAPVLVIVDQVEELISLSGADERDAFLSLVARALDADPRLRIIMIMRSEFLTAFLGHRAGSVVPQPGHDGDAGSRGAGRGDRATGPAGGVTFDPPILPQRMAADARAGDALPLLAYSCTEPSAQPRAVSSLDAELASAKSGDRPWS